MANSRSANDSDKRSQAARVSISIKDSPEVLNRATLDMYQSFMAGYVRRINESTFRVAIGGVRIGSAKYSRLAQINLKTRIMTFSRYAIENVPERGRRYLVLHELAHVKEASHNRRFWQLVANFEPDYKQIGRNLELAFKQNVKEEAHRKKAKRYHSLFSGLIGQRAEPKSLHIDLVPKWQAQENTLLLLAEDEREKDHGLVEDVSIANMGSQQLITPRPIFEQLSLFD